MKELVRDLRIANDNLYSVNQMLEQKVEILHSIIKEVREYNKSILKEKWYGGNEKEYAKHNLEMLDKAGVDKE